MAGWVKLHRDLLDSACFVNPNTLKVWVWLMLKAAHEKRFRGVGNGSGVITVELEPGQIIWGRKAVSEELGMSESTAYRQLKFLEELGNISIDVNSHFSIVTICNWSTYQEEKTTREQATDRRRTTREQHANNTRTTREQHANTIEECKEEEELKECKEPKKQKQVFDSGNSEIEIPEKEKNEEPPAPNLYEIAWQEFREAYPRKEGIERAKNEFFALVIQRGIPCKTIIQAASAYAKAKADVEMKHLKLPVGWLIEGYWAEDWEKIAQEAAKQAAGTPNGGEGKGKPAFDPIKAKNEALAKITAQMAEENKLLKQQNTHNGNAS